MEKETSADENSNNKGVFCYMARTEECEQAVASFWGEVSGELRTRGHGHDFIP